ncbi:hypothetical protein [Flavobacterium sp.]|uniref:hypothetical protein n=1 Tax=Flavobacterium sp. TaxID=239 RepID=UPI002D1FA686|nr:hypothetical protein [Flavobacterium sp.]
MSKEILLGEYLDGIYPQIFDGFTIERVFDSEQQHKGVDLIISKDNKEYYIDEKAQLDYLEIELPTFAFEITYIKDGEQKQGWVFDKGKITNMYFCITAICCNLENVPESGFKSCKIISVNREKLVNLLKSRGLDYNRIININQEIRSKNVDGRIPIDELNNFTEGNFNFSKSGKAEQPINIVLKIDFLINNKVAKKIY